MVGTLGSTGGDFVAGFKPLSVKTKSCLKKSVLLFKEMVLGGRSSLLNVFSATNLI